MDQPNTQLPKISHPYPPSYRSQLTSTPTQQRQPYRDPSYSSSSPPRTFDYQRRRDERHAAPGELGSGEVGPSGYLSENPYAELSRGPSPNLGVQQPLYPSRGNAYASPERGDARPGVSRTASTSSNYPMVDAGRLESGRGSGSGSKEDERPEGWTKEDEEAEKEFLSKGMVDWNVLKSWRFWIRKEWWFYYILLVVGCVLVILMSLYHDDIVKWLKPVATWMQNLPAGWTIPIAVFFVLSFPPLFGHEIVAILVGVVWGLWIGFGITAAGTLLGEIGNFYAFKYCLRSTAEKYEKNNINYACMAHVVREGGFFIIFVARLSAIPGHFTTAVFATCGMSIWTFTLAAILTLPKQLIVVYLGVIFESNQENGTSSKEKWISHSVLIVGFLVTIWAAWYIWRKMHQARIHVWRRRRIEAAAQGLVLDPKTGKARPPNGSKEWEHAIPSRLEEGDLEDESRSPILLEHRRESARMEEQRAQQGMDGGMGYGAGGARVQRHQSYQNPYDIRYQSTDTMSVYDVDGPPVHEQDISQGYRPFQSTDTIPAPSNAQPQLHSRSDVHPYPRVQPPHRAQSEDAGPPVSFPHAQATGVDEHQGAAVRRQVSQATVYAEREDPAAFPEPMPAVPSGGFASGTSGQGPHEYRR
ncbi:hypothetical protein IAT38_006437 [Cryptococcus sp. DSM 104549]